jgi:hypothetical protein
LAVRFQALTWQLKFPAICRLQTSIAERLHLAQRFGVAMVLGQHPLEEVQPLVAAQRKSSTTTLARLGVFLTSQLMVQHICNLVAQHRCDLGTQAIRFMLR